MDNTTYGHARPVADLGLQRFDIVADEYLSE